MSHTSREPSTKFYGPNAPIWPIVTPVSVDMQLHDLEPAQFWNPALEAELLTLRHLPRWPATQVFRVDTAHFNWWILWTKTMHRLNVREIGTGKWAFSLWLYYAVTRWGTNDITESTGYFAKNGTITISWIGA